MSDLSQVLGAFSAAYGTGAVLWTQSAPGATIEVAATSGGDVTPPEGFARIEGPEPVARETAVGRQLVLRVPGRTRAWLGLGPVADPDGASFPARGTDCPANPLDPIWCTASP